jgi:type IV pilus assembly protein PilM
MANLSLDSLRSLFSNLVKDRSASVVGIDVGSSAIKVVQMRREKGKAVLETYGAIALGPYGGTDIGRATNLPPDKIVEALKDVLREANVNASDASLSIPYSASLVSVVRVPEVSTKQLAQMMPIEARKYIPVPIAEVMLDWFPVPEERQTVAEHNETGPKKMSVLLVAIHNDTIAKYKSIIEGASLNASFFEIEVFSSVRASLDHGIAPVAVLDFGAGSTKLYIVERGIMRESHIINRGGQDLTIAISQSLGITVAQAEEMKRVKGLSDPTQTDLVKSIELSLQYITNEINRILISYQSRMQASVGKIVCVGGGSTLKGFKEHATKKLDTEVVLADPFGKTAAPAFLEEVLKEAGPEFSVAVGLALRRLQEVG